MKTQSKQYLEIKIDQACDKTWSKMSPQSTGRYCDHCEKVVRDFTEVTQSELIAFFQNQPKNICGRFRKEQLDQLYYFELSATKNLISPWRSVALIGGIMLGHFSLNGQLIKVPLLPPIQEKVEAAVCGGELIGERKIVGKVIDQKGEALIGVNIQIVGMTYGTVSDFEGEFILPVPNDLEQISVSFSFIGFESQILSFSSDQLNKNPKEQITLQGKNYLLEEVVVTAPSKRCVNTISGGASAIVHRLSAPRPNSIDKEVTDRTFIVSPNPFRSFLNIQIQAPAEGQYIVRFLNVSGQLLEQKVLDLIQGENQLPYLFSNFDNLASGAYLLQIIAPSKKSWIKQVIKTE